MSDDARQRLLAAAVTAFGRKGFHATTTRDIAEAAGMSPAAIYVHHRSKEDLLYVISAEGHRMLLQAVGDAVAAGDTPSESLAGLVRAWVITNARHHAASRVVKDELDALSAAHREEIVALRRQVEDIVRDVILAGIRTGEFASNAPHLTTRAVVSLGMDVARWYNPEGSWAVDDIADHFADLALRLVRR